MIVEHLRGRHFDLRDKDASLEDIMTQFNLSPYDVPYAVHIENHVSPTNNYTLFEFQICKSGEKEKEWKSEEEVVVTYGVNSGRIFSIKCLRDNFEERVGHMIANAAEDFKNFISKRSLPNRRPYRYYFLTVTMLWKLVFQHKI